MDKRIAVLGGAKADFEDLVAHYGEPDNLVHIRYQTDLLGLEFDDYLILKKVSRALEEKAKSRIRTKPVGNWYKPLPRWPTPDDDIDDDIPF